MIQDKFASPQTICISSRQVSCPKCSSGFNSNLSQENFLRVEQAGSGQGCPVTSSEELEASVQVADLNLQVNNFMQTAEASKTDTRKLVSQLSDIKNAAISFPGAVPPRSRQFLTLLNNLSNLHLFCDLVAL